MDFVPKDLTLYVSSFLDVHAIHLYAFTSKKFFQLLKTHKYCRLREIGTCIKNKSFFHNNRFGNAVNFYFQPNDVVVLRKYVHQGAMKCLTCELWFRKHEVHDRRCLNRMVKLLRCSLW